MWFLHPSSGAQITVSTASGISQQLLPVAVVEESRLTHANTHKIFFGTSEWEISRDRYRRYCDSCNSFLLPQSDLLYLLVVGAEGYSYADHTQ